MLWVYFIVTCDNKDILNLKLEFKKTHGWLKIERGEDENYSVIIFDIRSTWLFWYFKYNPSYIHETDHKKTIIINLSYKTTFNYIISFNLNAAEWCTYVSVN